MIKVYQLTQAQNNFIVLIPFKGCKVEAKFEKGNVSKGIYARLYTNDKFVQRAVESSEMYGTMFKLVQTLAEPGDNKPKPVKPAQPAAPVATQPAQPKAPVAPAAPEAEPTTPATEPAEADGKMTFANLAEAIVYIANQYQISVTTESEARNVLKEHGILPVIKRG
jgi:hypothetical protein